MSDPNIPAQSPAPGWYPDGSGATRWWDGVQWTQHVQQAQQLQYPQQQVAGLAERPRLPDTTPVDNAWVWVVSLLGFITVPLPFLLIEPQAYAEHALANDSAMLPSYTSGEILLNVISYAVYGLCVVAAFFDHRRLRSLGVERPFHWAFAFIGSTVYLIGRHVVLRKVVRTAGWPLWINLACIVVTFVVVIFWSVALFQAVMSSDLVYSY